MHHNQTPDWGAASGTRILPEYSPTVPLLPSRDPDQTAVIGDRHELISEPRLT